MLPIDIDLTTAGLIAVAAVVLTLVVLWIRPWEYDSAQEHQGWEGEHAGQLDRIVVEHRTGELPTLNSLAAKPDLPTVDEWERQEAQRLADANTVIRQAIDPYVTAEGHYPAPGTDDPDATAQIYLPAVRARVDLDTTLAIDAAWNQPRVEVPVITSVADETVVLTERVPAERPAPGRHRAQHGGRL